MSEPSQIDVYRRYATQCVAVAQTCPDTEGKLVLLEMARGWLLLAKQAAQNSQTMLVNETPVEDLHAD
jgi:hypothetical protein